MIKKYAFFILLTNFLITIKTKNPFSHDPYLIFPALFSLGAIATIGINFLGKKNIRNIPESIILGGSASTAFYEILYSVRSKMRSNNKENKNKNEQTTIDEKIIIDKTTNNKKEIKRINIFIHGSCSGAEEYTRPSGPKPSFTGLCRNIKEQFNTEEKVKKLYKDKTKFAENKKRKYLFEKNLFPLLGGLVPGLEQVKKDSITQIAFDFIYKPFISNQDNDNELSFIFNWDGDLSEISRKVAGENLREAIIWLNNNYITADIYCYAHSHGGNVLLHSMQKNSTKNEEHYKIKIGYLFGTPIGEKTENLIKNITEQTYEKIFNIFSYADYVQTGDITFSWGKLPKRIIKTEHKDILNIELLIEEKPNVTHEDFFLYLKNKNNNSALVRFFHNFDEIIKKEKNKQNCKYSLNTSTGTFTLIN
jgi:hypothetical protein